MTAAGRLLAPLVLVAACMLAACSTPEGKVESFTKRGEALMAKGDLVKARLEFQNALQVNPTAVAALFGLAQVAERQRDWRASYELLTKVVELRPDHVGALVRIGKLQLAAGQPDKAVATGNAAHALQPGAADVLALRAAVALKLDPRAAVALATQALAADPRHVDALVVLATERNHAGDGEAAIAFLDRGLAAHPRNVALHMLKVQALEKLRRPDRAEEVLHQLVKLFPGDTQYRLLLASFHVAHGRLDRAEAEYRAVTAASGKATAPQLQLVAFLEHAKGLDAAVAELESFSRAQPRAAELKLALAALRLRQDRPPAAIALWNEVIAGDDAAAGIRARGSMASWLIGRGETQAARALIAQMLEKDARDEQALFLRAGIAIDERKLEDAVADLRTVLRDTPDSARAHLVLAHAHELQGLRDLASQHHASAAQAGRFAPTYALPYAAHLVRTGRPQQAEGVLREALRAAPGHTATLKLLAEAYLRLGDVAAAQSVADQLGATPQGSLAATRIQAEVRMARREYVRGIESFKHAYALAPADPQALPAVVRGYLLAGKPKDALAFLQPLLAASPGSVPLRVLHGQVLALAGQPAAALAELQAALGLDPAHRAPHQALVALHVGSRDFDAALAAAEAGVKALPGDFGLRVTRATALGLAGRAEEAIAAYETMLAERPNAVIVANNLAALLADHRKDAASLRRAYDIAQRFRGTDIPHLKDTLGWTTHLAGKHQEAATPLREAAAAAPDLPAVQYHYGMNQLVLNNLPAAKAALGRSVELAKATPFAQAGDARRALQGL